MVKKNFLKIWKINLNIKKKTTLNYIEKRNMSNNTISRDLSLMFPGQVKIKI